MKVVQILYSFLLVEKQFSLESRPTAPTKEKRFAYSLYMDMLVLLVRVSRMIMRRSGDAPLADTRFISRLLLCEDLRILMKKYESEPFQLQSAAASVAERIADSGIYKRYLKDAGNDPDAGQEHLWHDLFNLVVMPDPELNLQIARRPNFTLKGVERMKDMMNETFVNFLGSQDNVLEVEKSLASSLDKARELYMRLLYLPVELTDLEDRILDENRHKFLKSEKDINPDMRFVENRMVQALRDNVELQGYVAKNKLSWYAEDPVLMRKLLKAVKDSEVYADYMASSEDSVKEDAALWRRLLKYVILDNPDFMEYLEEKSVFWNDDMEILSTFVLKGFRRIGEGDSASAVLDKFKDDEDARFGVELLRALYRNKDVYRRYIDESLASGSWDKDRIAFMDTIVIETALAEILNFPQIPLQVSVNEYIEIAKSYSTSKSGQFVHGVLGNILNRLRKEGLLRK